MKIKMIPKSSLMLFISSVFIVNFPIMAEVPPGPMNLSSEQKSCIDEYKESDRPEPSEMEKLFELCGIEAPKFGLDKKTKPKKTNKTEASSLEDCDCEEDSLLVKNTEKIEELLEKIEELEEKNKKLAKNNDRDESRKKMARRDLPDDENFDEEEAPSRKRSNARQQGETSLLDNIYAGYRGNRSKTLNSQSSYLSGNQNTYYNPSNPYAYAMTDLMGSGMGMSSMNMNSSMGMGMSMGSNLGMGSSLGMGTGMGMNMGIGMGMSAGMGLGTSMMGYSSMPSYSMNSYNAYNSYPNYYSYPSSNYATSGMSMGLGASFGLGMGTGMGYSYYGY